MRVLLIKPDARSAARIRDELDRVGESVDRAATTDQGLAAIAVQEYDAVILDLERLSRLGLEDLRDIRAACKRTPIMVLSGKDGAEDRIAFLKHGADDCLSEPYDMGELVARVRALTRRRYGLVSDMIRFGELEFDCASKTAWLNGDALALTERECSTLKILLAHRGRPVHKDRIYQSLYSFDRSEVGLNAVELYIARVRKKLGSSSISIKTLRQVGYQLCRE